MLFSDERLARDPAEGVVVGLPVRHPHVPQVLHLAPYLMRVEHVVDGGEAPEEELTLVSVTHGDRQKTPIFRPKTGKNE